MLDSLFSALAPHYCLSCGEIGRQICDDCFFDIDLSPRQTCLSCHGPLAQLQCLSCEQLRGVVQVVFAEREGILERLVNEYKFSGKKSTYEIIARLFAAYAPFFPESSQIVPIPTSSTHIRRRGFDHTKDIATHFAKLRGLMVAPLLVREHNLAQMGATAKVRRRQAATAFSLGRAPRDESVLHIICDDIVTTGASVEAAVGQLRLGGVRDIAILALLQQPWK